MNNYGIIYKVTNSLTNKIYIGQTIENLQIRKNKHYFKARKFLKENKYTNHFFNALNKYPEETFTWEIIDYASNQQELDEKEAYWIKYYNSIKHGYNIREGGLGRKEGDAFAHACGSKRFLLYNS